MDPSQLRSMLDKVRRGELGVDDALRTLQDAQDAGVADIGFAHVDLDRRRRCGYPEVIFCQSKTSEWIEGVVRRLQDAGQHCLATRVADDHADHLAKAFPAAQQDRVARTFFLPAGAKEPSRGRVVVLTAGTSDLPVAREAVVTIEAMGSEAHLIVDVGVAGLHRLLRHRSEFQGADAIIVVAGMDGALPSVVGGLVDCPVIAVPTSIGYGAAFQGVAPLLTMLNACSANVVVVNIDSGFKGGYVAALIARRSHPGS